jgi:ligand-binding sensor domain-containing protein/signal transduction histidine kinase
MQDAEVLIFLNISRGSGRLRPVSWKPEILPPVHREPSTPAYLPALLRMACGVLLACLCSAALASGPRSLRFERIGLDEGLSQESVLAILQDRDGFMWFGTQAGLNRFDGYRNQVFRNDPNDPSSLADNYVQAAYEDGQGRLWFGTRGGLVRFDPATRKFVRHPLLATSERNARNSAVTAIVGDGADGLWVGTSDGLVHMNPATGGLLTLRHDGRDAASLRDDRITALALDPRGGLWIGTGVGLDHLAAGAARFDHFDIDTAGNGKRNAVDALSMGPRDTLWIGTDAGLEAWRIGQGAPQRHHLGVDDGMNDGRVRSLYHDQGGTLWVGSDVDGLKWRDPTSGRFVGYVSQPLDRHTLSDNQVTSIWVDRTGTLWAGTMFGGVNRADLASGGFSRFSVLPGEATDARSARKIRSIATGADGRLWLGTTGGGLLHLDPQSGRADVLRHDPADPASLPGDVVNAVVPGRGRLWVGSPGGLSWRDANTGRFTQVPLGREAGASWVQSLMLDRAGALWIVTRGGLFMLEPDGRTLHGWRHDPAVPTSLGENYGFAVLEDRAGAIWIGTENGLDRYDRAHGTFTHFRHDPRDPASLRHNRVYYLYESARGDLWVGTAGGLHRMERGAGKGGSASASFRLFPVAPTREQVPIGGILEDGSGKIWVSTTVGLARVDPDTGRYKNYAANDGLTDGSYFVGSAARGADGELHFGGVGGMTSFQPEDIHDNPFPPTVVVTDFLVFNRPHRLPVAVDRLRDIRLSHRDSVFTLEFAALHYADPQANRYAYRLRGFDQEWTETDARKRFATYTNLDPGDYVFEVKAANKDGVWCEKPATLAISITPPFWMTWWFRLSCASVLAAGAVALYRLRVRVLVQQKERLERQVGARTAELVLQKEQAERRKHEAEAQKEAVEQARRNIALLSDIGRELTANLDDQAIMANVFGQVRQLMDAPLFAIGMARPGGPLDYPYVVADGRRVPEADRFPARVRGLGEYCLATGEEILIGDLARDYGRFAALVRDVLGTDPAHLDAGTLPAPRSLLFVPIGVGSRVLGVITVQSGRPGAYQNVQLDMLSTLASYVGVALDNADAYRQLKETQAQLAAREKLASLGALVAGVAHELNTPIGNSLLMASTLEEKTDALADRYAQGTLKKSDLETWIAAARDAASLIVRSLHAAADLVNSFKQVSVDQASTQRRRFDLGQACHEIAATMMNQVRRAGHTLELRVPQGIAMDSYPGPFGQVVINFINNALLHAFDAPGGHLLLVATPLDGERVRIEFSDDGRGIAPEHLSRIFDPFFTTRMGQGGTGLGLNIAYNLVTTLLQGTIRVESRPGQGTVFIVELPLRAIEAPLRGPVPGHA